MKTLNGLLMETSKGCNWLVSPPRIMARWVFSSLNLFSVASVICVLNWSSTNRGGFFRSPAGRLDHTFSIHIFMPFLSIHPLSWTWTILSGLPHLACFFSWKSALVAVWCHLHSRTTQPCHGFHHALRFSRLWFWHLSHQQSCLMEHQRLTGLHPCSQSGLRYSKSIFLSCIQYKFVKRHNLGFILYRHFLCNPSFGAHNKATSPHKSVTPWWWSSEVLNAFLCCQPFGFIDDHFSVSVDTEKPLFLWRVIHSFMSISNCGHFAACPQKHCFVLSVFLQLILLFPPFPYHVFGWRWPKVSLCCSVPMFFGVLHYLQLKRDCIWNPFLLWHLSTITVDSAGAYGRLSCFSTTKYSNERTISTVSFTVIGAL